ncbi:hypothetical protein DL93DRAFT_2091445 [Clavulina sp. PMI_390]|nr:hypothetical protein DL93DRAFT_2091445 [Clavulina sp. PMI_390]
MSQENDFTAQYSLQSIRILVESTLFLVPRALLEHHSYVLKQLLKNYDALGDSELSLELEGDAKTFEEVYKILFTPLSSCLVAQYADGLPLGRLLRLLIFLHKYRMTKFEARVLEYVNPLVLNGALAKSISESISAVRVFNLSHQLENNDFINAALGLILEGLWSKDPRVSAYDALEAAERYQNQILLGASYYRILLEGQQIWSKVPSLGEAQRSNLAHGMLSCGQEWDRLSLSLWNLEFDRPLITCRCNGECDGASLPFLGPEDPTVAFEASRTLAFEEIARAGLPWYDLIGRAAVIVKHFSQGSNGYGGRYHDCWQPENALNSIKDSISLHFVSESKTPPSSPPVHSLDMVPKEDSDTQKNVFLAPPGVEYHHSMRTASGSILLSVESVQFAIPAAIAQASSGTLRDMLNLGAPANELHLLEPIPLDDEWSTFKELRTIIFDPLESYLFRPDRVTNNLKQAFDLLELLHKYEFEVFEHHIYSLMAPMLSKTSLPKYLKDDFTVWDVFHRAQVLGCPEVAQTARAIMLERLWAKHPSVSPHYLLRFGEDLRDKTIIGAAYYHVVLGGGPAWMAADPLVTAEDCQRLNETRMKLADEWQVYADSIGAAKPSQRSLIHGCCWERPSVPLSKKAKKKLAAGPGPHWRALWANLAESRTQYFDLIGKVQVVVSTARAHPCGSGCSKTYDSELETLREGLYSYYPIPSPGKGS